MIRSFYHHGAEQPAHDLTLEQMRAALADAGGVLWVDLANPAPEEAHNVLEGVFRFPAPDVTASADGRRMPEGAPGEHLLVKLYSLSGDPPHQAVSACEVRCYVGRNFVVTHHLKPVPALDRLTERVMQDEQLLSQGAYGFACTLLQEILEEAERLLNVLSAAEAGLEVEILTAPQTSTLRRLLQLHRDVLRMEQALQRNTASLHRLASQELPNVAAAQQLRLRQLLEFGRELLGTATYLRELGRGTLDAYHLVALQDLNRFLKRVSAVSIILLAALFTIALGLAGVRDVAGLPFTGASVALLASVVVAILLVLLFHLRGWL